MDILTITASVSTQIAVMLILIMLGFFFTKKGYLTEKGISEITTLLLNVVTPCVLLRAYHIPFERSKITNLLYGYIISILVHAFYICIVKLYFINCKDKRKKTINETAAVYSNCGFMAIPLLEACFGKLGTFYGSSYLAVFNVVIWTVGLNRFKQTKLSRGNKKIFNPGTIGVAMGLIFYITQLKLPVFAYNAVSFVADLNTPLAMLVIGNLLAGSGILKAFKSLSVYKVLVFKLLLAPFIIAFPLKLIGADYTMAIAIIICAACPTAALVPIFAKKLNSDYDYATNITVASTLVSMLTIPLVCILCGLVL